MRVIQSYLVKPKQVSKHFALKNGKHITTRINRCSVILLNGLEKANKTKDRVCTLKEVLEVIPHSKIKYLESFNKNKNIHDVASHLFESLKEKRLVYKKVSPRYLAYYVSARLAVSMPSDLPVELSSNARQILAVIEKTVIFHVRSVRYEEVFQYATTTLKLNVNRRVILDSINVLLRTKRLVITARRRGDYRGGYYYLPMNFDANLYPPPPLVGLLDKIEYTFEVLWNEQSVLAVKNKVLPAPLFLKQLQARAQMLFPESFTTKNASEFPRHISQIVCQKNYKIRRIKVDHLATYVLAPFEVSNEQLDFDSLLLIGSQLRYNLKNETAMPVNRGVISDQVKVSIAVNRACSRYGHPVNYKDVEKEIAIDSSLSLISSGTVSSTLLSAVFAKSERNKKQWMGEKQSDIYKIGQIRGLSHYYSRESFGEAVAEAFFQYHELEKRLKSITAHESLEKLANCRLRGASTGRALMVLDELKEIKAILKDYTALTNLDDNTKTKLSELLINIKKLEPQYRKFLVEHRLPEFPDEVSSINIFGWTAEMIIKEFLPVYPMAREIDRTTTKTPVFKVTGLLRRHIKRRKVKDFPNIQVNSNDIYLYDRTNALLFAALKWGGPECRLQAIDAQAELGHLRDERFIIPELKSDDSNVRMAAVACISYLQTEGTVGKLRDIILSDSVVEVRMAALWGYAFAKDSDAYILAEEISKIEANPKLKNYALKILQTEHSQLWFL